MNDSSCNARLSSPPTMSVSLRAPRGHARGAMSSPMTMSQFCHRRTCMSFSPLPNADSTDSSFPPTGNMSFVRLPVSRPCGMR